MIGPQSPPVQLRNGFGVTALVLGIVGAGLGLIPLLGLVAIILGVLALVFGLISYSRTRRHTADNPVMSLIGAVLGAGSIALGIWGMTIVYRAADDLNQKIGNLNRDLSSIVAPPPAPALKCADFEPAPVTQPSTPFVDQKCTDPDGSTRWINAFYKCIDGRIWPLVSTLTPPASPPEPTGPEFDKCVGRS
jgi:hypothetical protein